MSLPDDLTGGYGVVLVYRGAWCPYCNAQLAAFQRATDRLADVGTRVTALSVDGRSETEALVAKHHLDFPVGYDADPDHLAQNWGTYLNAQPRYLQSTGIVLRPDGTILTVVYSSGAIGRLVPDDVVGLVRYTAQQNAE